ncbi:nitroreductase family deazaflavin-dependent oxidoreductase [Actinoplanes sp. TRM 88003]|uniref:Nitroreductase family deazaflavin-dependent oxidoreductase n=1 Tax=Paractinoplanes aksuensis TaxID=2939490 RepID=A0ABT1DSN6_9ACTN|nr:nitroreductase/quinone reductase family protein [Actinoplanes aksuensis]MCO8273859.1 nitroreductase family deazaflavin-dependent oxidoreductase [Actinoplanes aksuensis]
MSEFILRIGNRRWFAAGGRLLMPLDRRLIRLTKGRLSVTGWRTAPPTLLLTTRGRKSGLPRERPVLYVRDGDAYVVMGSNWGQAEHPAWSGNLLADPAATIVIDGESFAVRAALVEGPERERLWPLLLQVWPGYRDYDARTDRTLRIFRLEPARPPVIEP